MPDLLGPANAANAVTDRPPDTRVFGPDDTFFNDCSSPTADDGTDIEAAFLNGLLMQFRRGIRLSNVSINNSDDDMLAKAIRSQRMNYRSATGTANALTINLDPAPASYDELLGVPLRVKISFNNTGAATLNVNGLGARSIVVGSGTTLVGRELAVGEIVDLIYDGLYFQILNEKGSGRLIGVQVFSTSGTYTPTPGTKAVVSEVQAAGGAGGGTQSTSTGSYVAAGVGGAAGGYASSYLTSGFSGQTVIVGAGGVGVAGGNGGNGGNSSFGSLLSATGGNGGGVGTNVFVANAAQPVGGATGGLGSGGNLVNAAGGLGRYALYAASPLSGEGGSSFFGAGAYYRSGTSAGLAATSPGAGGSGASSLGGNPSGIVGGNGAPGIVIIWEYA